MTTQDNIVFEENKETIDEVKAAKAKVKAEKAKAKADKEAAKAEKEKERLEIEKIEAAATKRFHARHGWVEYPANKNGQVRVYKIS